MRFIAYTTTVFNDAKYFPHLMKFFIHAVFRK